MMRQCEFQTMYDPDLDMYVTKNIFDDDMTVGGGMTDIFKAIGNKIFRKAAKKAATTGKMVGNKAGDKIVNLLRNNNATTKSLMMEPNISTPESEALTTQEINDRVNQILLGGRMRKMKFI